MSRRLGSAIAFAAFLILWSPAAGVVRGALRSAFPGWFQFIVGGSVGLFAALGIRNASSAIGWASLLLPFATFFAITNFLVDHVAAAFFVTAATYGFTTAAMLVPALNEFDIASGRTRAATEE